MASKPKKESAPLPKSIIAALPVAYEVFKHLQAAEALLQQDLPDQLRDAHRAGAVQTARAFVVLGRLKDRFEGVGKVINAAHEAEKTSNVPLAIEYEGLNNIPLAEEGFRVTNSIKLRASIIASAKDDAYAWLRDNKMGSLITESVNVSSLSADLGYMINEENREPPVGLFNVFHAMTASVTAVNNNKK